MPEALPLDARIAFHIAMGATLSRFLQRPVGPTLGNTSPVKYRQSFVDDDPYQPTAESALAIKYCNTVRYREQTVFYSNISSVRIAKHAVRDKMEQAAISRCPNIRGHTVVRRILPDRISFVQLQLQVQSGPHISPLLAEFVALRYSVLAAQLGL
jgi:hypothetical protein